MSSAEELENSEKQNKLKRPTPALQRKELTSWYSPLKTFLSAHMLIRIDTCILGFPGDTVVKTLPASAGEARDLGSIPGLGRPPGEGNGNPLQCSCLGKPMDREAWRATVHGVAESETTERAHTHIFQCWQQSNKADKIIPIVQIKEEEMENARRLLFCSRSHHWWVPGC